MSEQNDRLIYAVTDAEAYADVYGTAWVRIERTMSDVGYTYTPVDPTEVRVLQRPGCGGCAGMGSHKRWCPTTSGHRAAILGRAADEAESLGDTVGSNYTFGANALYRTSGLLREEAKDAAVQHIALNHLR